MDPRPRWEPRRLSPIRGLFAVAGPGRKRSWWASERRCEDSGPAVQPEYSTPNWCSAGRGGGIRTLDLLNPIQVHNRILGA